MGDIGEFFEDTFEDVVDYGKDAVEFVKEYSKYTPFTGYGAFQAGGPTSRAGAALGIHTADVTKTNKDRDKAEAGARASADAKIRQAEYEEQAAMGAERTRAKRRRGFSSTIIGGGPTTLGGGLSDSGKTLLGD